MIYSENMIYYMHEIRLYISHMVSKYVFWHIVLFSSVYFSEKCKYRYIRIDVDVRERETKYNVAISTVIYLYVLNDMIQLTFTQWKP